MKKSIRVSRVLFMVIAMWITAILAHAHTVPQPVLDRLSRGINLHGWASSTSATMITPVRVANLVALGFKHVRIPIDPEKYYADSEGYRNKLDKIIRTANDAGLLAIIDFHPEKAFRDNMLAKTSATEVLTLNIWQSLAAHIHKVANPNQVVLELYNEPNLPTSTWQPFAAQLISKVRQAAPSITLLIGGTASNSAEELQKFTPFSEQNLGYTFHYYNPHTFTHQGQTWDSSVPTYALSNITFPPVIVSNTWLLIQKLTVQKNAKALYWLFGYLSNFNITQTIQNDFNTIGAWQKKWQVPVFMSEFGTIIYAPNSGRVQWSNLVRQEAEKNHFGWSLWSYSSDFGLFSPQADGSLKLNKSLAAALGLNVIASDIIQ